jgi:hypothetical protein
MLDPVCFRGKLFSNRCQAAAFGMVEGEGLPPTEIESSVTDSTTYECERPAMTRALPKKPAATKPAAAKPAAAKPAAAKPAPGKPSPKKPAVSTERGTPKP